MRSGVRYAIAGAAAHAMLGALFATVRFEREGAQHYRTLLEGEGCIFVLWHGRLLPLAYLHRHEGHATLVSRSADGEYLSRLLQRWGYLPVRGSSSSGGGAAVRAMARQARGGRSLVVTPDGPRGPRERMKDGALYLARLSGLPIVPVSAAADRSWWVHGWDRFLVPQPGTRIRVRYAPPFHVARDADAAEIGRRAVELEQILRALTQRLDDE
jgi:lysophospholipid acyltransferase (LPLAT)-like uncharacterized protein